MTGLTDLGPLEQLRAGRLARRLTQMVAGLTFYGVSLGMMVHGAVGLAPWDVLHSGIARHVPLTIGQVLILTSLVVLLAWIPLREVPGVATIANPLIIGVSADATIWLLDRPGLADALDPLLARYALMLGGIGLLGFASALYIGAQLGRGPRDGLMTGLVRRTGAQLWIVRTGIEVTVVLLGLMLGGILGVGTVLLALTIGPLTQTMLPRWIVELERPVAERVEVAS